MQHKAEHYKKGNLSIRRWTPETITGGSQPVLYTTKKNNFSEENIQKKMIRRKYIIENGCKAIKPLGKTVIKLPVISPNFSFKGTFFKKNSKSLLIKTDGFLNLSKLRQYENNTIKNYNITNIPLPSGVISMPTTKKLIPLYKKYVFKF
jgi:hypothetical protein